MINNVTQGIRPASSTRAAKVNFSYRQERIGRLLYLKKGGSIR